MRSITGASAEMRIGIGMASATSIGLCTRNVVVLDVDRARPRERAVQHLEVVPHEVGRTLVREAELILDDPVVRRPEAEREPAAARHLRGERLLRHRDRMTGLDRDDRGADLDALGHLADDRDRGHGVEVAGDLRDPHRGEAGLIGRLDVGHQPRQPIGAVALLVGADHQPDAHLQAVPSARE